MIHNMGTTARPDRSAARRITCIASMREALDKGTHRNAPARTLELAFASLALARDCDDPESIVQSLQLAACSNMALGNYDAALQQLSDALQISIGHGNDTLTGESLFRTAVVYDEAGNPWKSLELGMQSLVYLERAGCLTKVAQACTMVGTLFTQLGIVPPALQHLHRSLDIGKEANAAHRASPALIALGRAYTALCEWDRALEYHNKALVLAQQTGDEQDRATALVNIGEVCAELGDHSRALRHLRKALALSRKEGHKQNQAYALSSMGYVHHRSGSHARALACHRRALMLIEALPGSRPITQMLLHIGTAHMHMEQFSPAQKYGAWALTDAERLGSYRLRVRAHRFLSDLYRRSDDFKHALDHHETAMQIQEEAERERDVRMIEWLQARLELERMRAERDVLTQRNAALELEVRNISRERSALLLQIGARNQLLTTLKGKLLGVVRLSPERVRASLEHSIADIERTTTSAHGWGPLMQQAGADQESFIHRLAVDYPELTPIELKVCSLLRMNITNKEIAALLCMSVRSVEDHRYQVRKKIGLARGTHLVAFLTSR